LCLDNSTSLIYFQIIFENIASNLSKIIYFVDDISRLYGGPYDDMIHCRVLMICRVLMVYCRVCSGPNDTLQVV